MSTNDEHSSNFSPPEPAADAVNLQDLVLDLNFTPTWARKSSDAPNPYENREDRDSGRGHGGSRDRDRRNGGSPTGGRKSFGGPRRETRDGKAPDQRDRQPLERPRRGNDQRFPPREERVHLPVDVSFIPDRDRLGAVVKQLHAVKRAFPLTYVSGLFLSKPEYHQLKLEVRTGRPGADGLQFFQCRATKVVFLSKNDLMDYLVRTHLAQHFDRIEVTIEPPAGNFICVGQCKRSGVILGPPNYHGYNERLLELHRSRFANLSLDQYRNQIEMVRDPAIIEKWKDECRIQVRYRQREAPDAEATLTLTQAESLFLEKYAASYVHSGVKVIMPATAVQAITDERLRQVIEAAWTREDRFPLSLMLALRPAFRRMRLSLFKAGKDETFVACIPPKPFDAEHAIPEIKDMVALIAAHPGWNRKQLVEKLYPGKSPDDPDVVEKMNPLIWLIDKGHIIEFFNGTYAVPGHLRSPGAVPTETPKEIPHGEATPVAVTETVVEVVTPPATVEASSESAEPLPDQKPVD